MQTVRHEEDSVEVNIDISELNLQHSSIIEQGLFGESEKVKWRGTWVFLGSIVHGDEMILITEYLPKGNMQDILRKRLDPPTALRYALDIARGMNYLHRHKPLPIVHNNLHLNTVKLQVVYISVLCALLIGLEIFILLNVQLAYYFITQSNWGNLLLDECGHLKIGQTNNGCNLISHLCHDISKDIYSFGLIFYQVDSRSSPIVNRGLHKYSYFYKAIICYSDRNPRRSLFTIKKNRLPAV
uniref:Protein kinase domain-containing protein n=1 Tax=Solanum lycopersicum TaxID=4081 RepID=A0A3Q7FC68_SOLLC